MTNIMLQFYLSIVALMLLIMMIILFVSKLRMHVSKTEKVVIVIISLAAVICTAYTIYGWMYIIFSLQ